MVIALAETNAVHPLSNTFDLPVRQNSCNKVVKENISASKRLQTAPHLTKFDENPNL